MRYITSTSTSVVHPLWRHAAVVALACCMAALALLVATNDASANTVIGSSGYPGAAQETSAMTGVGFLNFHSYVGWDPTKVWRSPSPSGGGRQYVKVTHLVYRYNPYTNTESYVGGLWSARWIDPGYMATLDGGWVSVLAPDNYRVYTSATWQNSAGTTIATRLWINNHGTDYACSDGADVCQVRATWRTAFISVYTSGSMLYTPIPGGNIVYAYRGAPDKRTARARTVGGVPQPGGGQGAAGGRLAAPPAMRGLPARRTPAN